MRNIEFSCVKSPESRGFFLIRIKRHFTNGIRENETFEPLGKPALRLQFRFNLLLFNL